MNISKYICKDVLACFLEEEERCYSNGEGFPAEFWISQSIHNIVTHCPEYKNGKRQIIDHGTAMLDIGNENGEYIGTIQIDGQMDNAGYLDDLFRLFPYSKQIVTFFETQEYKFKCRSGREFSNSDIELR